VSHTGAGRIEVIGDATSATAYARVNAVWRHALRDAGYRVDEGGPATVTIHHDYSQHFATCDAGAGARKAAVRTWDFGPFPRAWAARIGRDFDRLWVHSDWVRDKAIESGIARELVAVVPHGFDPDVFTPEGPAADLGPGFNFLFVGATVARKGIDILLAAYERAFTPDDPVCLVLKGHSADVFYRGQHMAQAIADFQNDPQKPRLRLLDAYLSDAELAALYRGADAAVFPYRGEGFAIPILEAMACGLSCIVPRFGACLDYCTADVSLFVEARRIRLPLRREMVFNTLGFREQVDLVDFCEVPVDGLAAALRAAYEAGVPSLRARGRRAAQAVHTTWTWRHSTARLLDALAELQQTHSRRMRA
jgi:glycosyltransferase involved in cell wall biosynthesis